MVIACIFVQLCETEIRYWRIWYCGLIVPSLSKVCLRRVALMMESRVWWVYNQYDAMAMLVEMDGLLNEMDNLTWVIFVGWVNSRVRSKCLETGRLWLVTGRGLRSSESGDLLQVPVTLSKKKCQDQARLFLQISREYSAPVLAPGCWGWAGLNTQAGLGRAQFCCYLQPGPTPGSEQRFRN